MSQAREARRLFDRVIDLAAEERERVLSECSDETVRGLVLRLLAAHACETGFLERAPNPTTDRTAVTPGRRLGPYVLESEIGRGGMGTVYRAVRCDDVYRKTVAIKVVSLGMDADLFRRERQIMASLEHANIARLLDGGATEDGSLYLVMEFVDGEPINVWADRRGLSTRGRLELLLSVCDAVSYAHRNLVVHRDLKPANILVTADGIPKLLDFGVARVVAAETGSAQTIRAALTPEYASPEQVRGDNISTATDVYSFGVVLFHLLTRGQRPYGAARDTLAASLRAVLEEEPRRPSACVEGKLQRELRGELDNIVLRAIAKAPERRYVSMQQLRADIEGWLTGRPVLAQGDDFWYLTGKFVRRRWLPLAAAAAVLVSSAAGTLAVWRQTGIAEQRRITAENAVRRSGELLRSRQLLLTQQVTLRGRAEAEARRAEAEARRAQEQRGIAETRLRHARDLAASLLFDIHDAVRDLSGASAARRKIVESAVKQLEALSRDAPEDTRLLRILAAAYERAGDLVGGVVAEGSDGTSAGLDWYRKSLAVQQHLMREAAAAAVADNWLRLAHAYRRVGLVENRNQDVKAAALSLRHALRSLEAGGRRGGHWPEAEADIYHQLCHYEVSTGDRDAATAACRGAIARMRQFVSTEFAAPAARHNRAVNFQRLAWLTQEAGDVPAALELLNAGIQEQTRLVREHPENAAYRRSLSIMLGYLARWREKIEGTNAIPGYLQALESFRAIRAADIRQTVISMLHAWTAMRYAVVLHQAGRDAEARTAAGESILLYEELIRAPKAGFMEFNDFANEMLRCPFPDLCDVRVALKHAQTAVEMTKGENPFALDTLANAQFRNGAVARAIETGRSALARAGNLPQAARDEIRTAIARFEAAAAR
jgi:tetratricopeptide (TPR) repeat protein